MRSSPFGSNISRIDLSNHENAEKRVLVKKLHEAACLTLDIENKQMYMTDLAAAVYTVRMDGSGEKVRFSDLGDLPGITYGTIL